MNWKVKMTVPWRKLVDNMNSLRLLLSKNSKNHENRIKYRPCYIKLDFHENLLSDNYKNASSSAKLLQGNFLIYFSGNFDIFKQMIEYFYFLTWIKEEAVRGRMFQVEAATMKDIDALLFVEEDFVRKTRAPSKDRLSFWWKSELLHFLMHSGQLRCSVHVCPRAIRPDLGLPYLDAGKCVIRVVELMRTVAEIGFVNTYNI